MLTYLRTGLFLTLLALLGACSGGGGGDSASVDPGPPPPGGPVDPPPPQFPTSGTPYADAGELVGALVKLYNDNSATLTPDPLHSAFYDSHPPAAAHIARLRTA